MKLLKLLKCIFIVLLMINIVFSQVVYGRNLEPYYLSKIESNKTAIDLKDQFKKVNKKHLSTCYKIIISTNASRSPMIKSLGGIALFFALNQQEFIKYKTQVDSEPEIRNKIVGSPAYLADVKKVEQAVFNSLEAQNKQNAVKEASKAALTQIIKDIYCIKSNTSNIKDANFYCLCNTINDLVSKAGAIDKELHYFRIYLNRTPKSLEAMIQTNRKLPEEQKWVLLSPEQSVYHMYGADGEFNLKFVSADGHFEAVYKKNGELLTEKNDPINMGTYNYADPLTDPIHHAMFDVWPYNSWGNLPGVITSKENTLQKYNGNDDAVGHRLEVMRRLAD